MSRLRYIGYPAIGSNGGGGVGPKKFLTLAEARCYFREYARNSWVVPENAFMTLYAFAEDEEFNTAWQYALDFAGTGVPFDCPDYCLTAGPRGGITTEKC